MKSKIIKIWGVFFWVGILSLLFAVNSPAEVISDPVGPAHFNWSNSETNGQLEVFSALEGHSEGDNPGWFQHADYYLYSQQGRKLKHVNNIVGYYEQEPCVITLPPGKYFVKAPAKDVLWMKVPVVIEAGRVTQVHLDGGWQIPPNTPKVKIVTAPGGYPIGWRAAEKP